MRLGRVNSPAAFICHGGAQISLSRADFRFTSRRVTAQRFAQCLFIAPVPLAVIRVALRSVFRTKAAIDS